MNEQKAIEYQDQMTLKSKETVGLENLKRGHKDVITEDEMNKIQTIGGLFKHDKLEQILESTKSSYAVVRDFGKEIRKINKPEPENDLAVTAEEMVISMSKTTYHTWEGSPAVFIDCTVDPLPERVIWRTGKSTPPNKRVPVDNRKYYYGPKAPSLVIRDPDINTDEAYYQCMAAASGKTVVGDIVRLRVSAATMNNARTSDIPTNSQSSVAEPEPILQKQAAATTNNARTSDIPTSSQSSVAELEPILQKQGSDAETNINEREGNTVAKDEQFKPGKGQKRKRSIRLHHRVDGGSHNQKNPVHNHPTA